VLPAGDVVGVGEADLGGDGGPDGAEVYVGHPLGHALTNHPALLGEGVERV
jgi:hypothetical protein